VGAGEIELSRLRVENIRLKRELEIIKKRRRTLRGRFCEVRLNGCLNRQALCAGGAVRGTGGQRQRLSGTPGDRALLPHPQERLPDRGPATGHDRQAAAHHRAVPDRCLAHCCPDAIRPHLSRFPADLFFHQDEWRAADFLNKQKPPADMPALNEVPRRVAMCGGFLGRKGDGEPGVKTIWLGLPRVTDCAIGLQFARDLVPCELGIRICADSPSGTRTQRLARSMADIEEEVIMSSIRLILN